MALGITINSPLGPGKMIFRALDGVENLGRPFEYRLQFLSQETALDLDKLVGKALTIHFAFDDTPKRFINAYVIEASQPTRMDGRLYVYEAILRPQMWLLTMASDCKVFQEKTAPEIIEDILRKHGITDFRKALSRTYLKREYCVQYCETDFAFISRLMEIEGIYYFFEHADAKHTLVLADSISAHSKLPGDPKLAYLPPRDGYVGDYVFDWRLAKQMRSAAYEHTDYDFTLPKKDLKSRNATQRPGADSKLELFNYPGSFAETKDGEQYARNRLEENEADYEVQTGKTNARQFTAGRLFDLKDYPRADQNREHLITSVGLHIEQEIDTASGMGALQEISTTYGYEFSSIPSRRVFRAACSTPRPVVKGPLTAIVVGKKGEEIWTDKYGRVKVQFYWDRYGKKDENSSCWVRVSQSWAGKAWGGIQIPRIDQEVVVEFIDGDPDSPIITGRVYNGDMGVPYTLPDNQTQSGVKSRSTKEGADTNFNELRFEDKKGEEEIYFHAEKNFTRIVENDDVLKVGFEKKDKGNQTVDIYQDRTVTLDQGNDKLQIKTGNRTELIDTGNDDYTLAKGNRTASIDTGNDTLTIKAGDQTIKLDAGTCTIDAATAIELIVGGSSISIKPDSITLKSVNITIEASGKATVKGANVAINGSADVTIQGGVVKIN